MYVIFSCKLYSFTVYKSCIETAAKNSQRAKAATAISAHSKRVILLSGTPALSRPEELFSQLQILESKPIFGGYPNDRFLTLVGHRLNT